MLVEPVIFYLISLTSMVLSIVFLMLVTSYVRLLGQNRQKDRELEDLRQSVRKKALRLVEDARDKSLKIIEDANRSAASIIQQAKISSHVSEEMLHDQLAKITAAQADSLKQQSEQFLAQFHVMLEGLQSQDADTLQNVASNVQTQVASQTEQFRKSIEQETIETEQRIAAELQKNYEVLKKELENYKFSQMKKIDDSIYTILMFTTKQIIGKVLNLEEQQQLIKNTLEEAKKKGELVHE